MSNHNNLNWSDFLLCIGMELAFHKNGERPIQEQMIAEKLMEIQDRYPALKSINVGQVIGTPEHVILEQLERFGKEVMPKVRKENLAKI